MTRYDWTPASEPPDSYRVVLVWTIYYPSGRGHFDSGSYSNGRWSASGITHWCDVAPPTPPSFPPLPRPILDGPDPET